MAAGNRCTLHPARLGAFSGLLHCTSPGGGRSAVRERSVGDRDSCPCSAPAALPGRKRACHSALSASPDLDGPVLAAAAALCQPAADRAHAGAAALGHCRSVRVGAVPDRRPAGNDSATRRDGGGGRGRADHRGGAAAPQLGVPVPDHAAGGSGLVAAVGGFSARPLPLRPPARVGERHRRAAAARGRSRSQRGSRLRRAGDRSGGGCAARRPSAARTLGAHSGSPPKGAASDRPHRSGGRPALSPRASRFHQGDRAPAALRVRADRAGLFRALVRGGRY